MQAHEREAAREAREAQSRAALQAAQRRAQLEAERKAAQEAAAKAEREARAEQAGLRLAALKGQWAEHAALQQVRCRLAVHAYLPGLQGGMPADTASFSSSILLETEQCLPCYITCCRNKGTAILMRLPALSASAPCQMHAEMRFCNARAVKAWVWQLAHACLTPCPGRACATRFPDLTCEDAHNLTLLLAADRSPGSAADQPAHCAVHWTGC